ncbi:MAG: hypothetical protein C0P64_000060 [Bacillota bacterium]|jgi:hypothetical protein
MLFTLGCLLALVAFILIVVGVLPRPTHNMKPQYSLAVLGLLVGAVSAALIFMDL